MVAPLAAIDERCWRNKANSHTAICNKATRNPSGLCDACAEALRQPNPQSPDLAHYARAAGILGTDTLGRIQ